MTINPTPSICQDGTLTIASGASLSDALNLGGNILLGFYMPASWTTAAVTFAASEDGVTYSPVVKDGSELSVTAAAGQYIVLFPADFMGIRYLRLRSGTSSAAVNQGAARDLTIIVGRPAS